MKFALCSGLLALLLALFAWILDSFHSPESQWALYAPRLGEPEQVLSFNDRGNVQCFELKASEAQVAHWVKTLGLIKKPEQSSWISQEPLSFVWGESPASYPCRIEISPYRNHEYKFDINHLIDGNEARQNIKKIVIDQNEQPRWERIYEAAKLISLLIIPALWGLSMSIATGKGARRGMLWSWVQATLFAYVAWFSIAPFCFIYGNFRVEDAKLVILAGFLFWPLFNLISCTLFYLPWSLLSKIREKKKYKHPIKHPSP